MMKAYEVYERVTDIGGVDVHAEIELDHLQREKGRLKAFSTADELIHIFLERGKTLRIGELLRSDSGEVFRINAALESVVTATADDWMSFSQACYHLGNRHVKIQIGDKWLRMTPDHVLESMLVQLGLQVTHEKVAFEPESGAYQHHHD